MTTGAERVKSPVPLTHPSLLQVELHELVQRERVDLEGLLQQVLADALVRTVHHANPFGILNPRLFGTEAGTALELARVRAAAHGERLRVLAGGLVVRVQQRLDHRAP